VKFVKFVKFLITQNKTIKKAQKIIMINNTDDASEIYASGDYVRLSLKAAVYEGGNHICGSISR